MKKLYLAILVMIVVLFTVSPVTSLTFLIRGMDNGLENPCAFGNADYRFHEYGAWGDWEEEILDASGKHQFDRSPPTNSSWETHVYKAAWYYDDPPSPGHLETACDPAANRTHLHLLEGDNK